MKGDNIGELAISHDQLDAMQKVIAGCVSIKELMTPKERKVFDSLTISQGITTEDMEHLKTVRAIENQHLRRIDQLKTETSQTRKAAKETKKRQSGTHAKLDRKLTEQAKRIKELETALKAETEKRRQAEEERDAARRAYLALLNGGGAK